MKNREPRFRIKSLRTRLMIVAMMVFVALFIIIYYGVSTYAGVVWVTNWEDVPPEVVIQVQKASKLMVVTIFLTVLPFWVVGSMFFSRRFANPFVSLSESAREVELTGAREPVDLHVANSVFSSSDEIEQLKGMVSSMVSTLRTTDEQFRSVVSNQRELIFRWKPDFSLSFVNRAFLDFFGGDESFWLNTPGEELEKLIEARYPDLVRVIKGEILVNLEFDSETVSETFLKMPDGKIQWVRWHTMALYDRAGNIYECQTIGNVLTELKRAQVELEEANYQLAMLSQELIKSQEEERFNVARYLHDQVLGELGEMARGSDDSLDQATMNRVIDKLRTMIYVMRSPMLNYGLSMALEDLADHMREQVSQMKGLTFIYDVPSSLARFDRQVETQIYRIVQEACKNSFDHARASVIRIYGKIEDDMIDLSILDNGSGFSLSRNEQGTLVSSQHYGMVGMEERCKIIGAQLMINSKIGGGTTVQVIWRPDLILTPGAGEITRPIDLPEK